MSDGNGTNGVGKNGKNGQGRPDDWEVRHKAGQRRVGKNALVPGVQTPEQGCITCLVGTLIILVSLAFWGYIYWRYNPEFHPDQSGATPKASPHPLTPSPADGRGGTRRDAGRN